MKARILNLLIKEIRIYENKIDLQFNTKGMPLLYETLKTEVENAN